MARTCRAQVSLRDVLVGDDLDRLAAALGRLDAIGTLMEKQSRVASWSVRTVTGPLLALVGFVSYNAIGLLTPRIGATWVQGLRYVVVGSAGALFLCLGLKAVHLTEMANRVWKRRAEYGLILAERRRLAGSPPQPSAAAAPAPATDAGAAAPGRAPDADRTSRQPVRRSPLHLSDDAPRLTALFVGCVCPTCALLTPCQPGASPLSAPARFHHGLYGFVTGRHGSLHLFVFGSSQTLYSPAMAERARTTDRTWN